MKAAKYLFDLICPQVDDLAERAWKVEGGYDDTRRFMHAFRLGCSITINDRLIDQAREKDGQMRTGKCGESPSESSTALMVINRRLEKVEKYAEGLGLKYTRGPSISNRNALDLGQAYGNKVNIGGQAKGGLNAPRKQVS